MSYWNCEMSAVLPTLAEPITTTLRVGSQNDVRQGLVAIVLGNCIVRVG